MKDLIKILGVLAIIAILFSIIMAFIGMLGSMKLTNGCFLRYDADQEGGTSDHITNTVMLNATGNYTTNATARSDDSQALDLDYDSSHYGEWHNTTLNVTSGQKVKLKIEGEISLCRAYLPKNNLQQTSNLDSQGHLVAIPRLEEVNLEPVSLIFNATTDEWRNITELYNNDRVVVSILPNQKPQPNTPSTVQVKNVFKLIKDGAIYKNFLETADCKEGRTTYSPLCGRYSIYFGEYVSNCELRNDYYYGGKQRHCPSGCFLGCMELNSKGFCTIAFDCCATYTCPKLSAYVNVMKTAPEAYADDGKYSFVWSKDLNKLFFNTNLRCTYTDDVPTGQCPDPGNYKAKDASTIQSLVYQDSKRFWYTAPTGLLSRVDNSEIPSSAKILGSNFEVVGLKLDDGFYEEVNKNQSDNQKYRVIYNDTVLNKASTISYLQYRLWSVFQDYSKNTGGYVLNIKHTKCRRTNGNSFDDTIEGRGRVEYIMVPYDEDPNSSGKSYNKEVVTPTDDKGNAEIVMNKEGYVWMRIFNKQEDYKESYGAYKVQMYTSEKVGSFTLLIATPLFTLLKGKITEASVKIFSNMTCMGGEGNCSNFFNYIKALLILYIITYVIMFMIGMVKITQQDLVIRGIKIALVSGLINGSTFEFFNTYIFNAITNFSDGLLLNMSGYSMFSSSDTVINPFMFLDAVMSKVLMGKTFSAQLLSFISMGLSGLIYFVIVFIAVIIVIITALRAMAVYVMALLATAILIGIAPLFFTFMLFNFTRYLFENWVRFTIKYIMEPLVLMAGIIIMTQLFTIYLDFAVGFSVCWKCALPIKIPFPDIPGFKLAFTDVPIFCINWFAPWGMDARSGMMGANMQHFIALIIIAYGMYGYVEFSGRMVEKLTSTAGPMATYIGASMSSQMEDSVLREVGLDRNTRGQIESAAEGRLQTRNKLLDKLSKGKEKPDTDAGSESTAARGDE